MIAHCDGIVAHQIHSRDVGFTAEDRGHGGSYQQVSAVHQEDVFGLFSDLLDQRGSSGDSSKAFGGTLVERLERAMMFAGVQDRQGGLREGWARGSTGKEKNQNDQDVRHCARGAIGMMEGIIVVTLDGTGGVFVCQAGILLH
jgi:hypothetical protein